LISTLKTTKKANAVSSTAPVAPEASQVINKRPRTLNLRHRRHSHKPRV
jgi:hypothetical protein